VSADFGGGSHVRTFRLSDFDNATGLGIYLPANQVDNSGGTTDPATVDPNYVGASFFAYGAGFRGGTRIGVVQDVNGDGRDDLLTGPGLNGGPQVVIRSGKDVTVLLSSLFAFAPTDRAGVFVGGGG
jgi:hypothetical protein